MANEQESKVLLKLLVDEKKGQVVAAESGVDFMDILASLLTLPLGTIMRLTKADAGAIGCINNLRQSVENLGMEHFYADHCKAMLLNPRNPYPKYCMKLKMHPDDSGSEKYYQCSKCTHLSYYMNTECHCGGTTNTEKIWRDSTENTRGNECVFVKGGISFLISDDLQVKCASLCSLVQILSNVGLSDVSQTRDMHVEVGKDEVIHLLARSLISKSPLSDVFLPQLKQKRARVDSITTSLSQHLSSISENGTLSNNKKLEVRLTLRKSTNKVLCAEAGSEFIDFLFNLLTIPIGSIEDVLKGSSGLGSIDNLYKSMETLDSKWFNTPRNKNPYGNLKRIILKPGIAPLHKSKTQLLQISEGAIEANLCAMDPVKGSFLPIVRKFVKEPSIYYVMDTLEVKPLSSTSTICLLQELNVPIFDIEEQLVSVGESEALRLLKASLTSPSSVLTEALNHMLKKQNVKTEV